MSSPLVFRALYKAPALWMVLYDQGLSIYHQFQIAFNLAASLCGEALSVTFQSFRLVYLIFVLFCNFQELI